MKTILLTNDDGYLSEGIRAIKEVLAQKYTVYTVAPDRERSAVSMSLTINHPLRLEQVEEREFIVDGTPTDCVNLGLQKVLPVDPDFIVSGMNHGENLSEDVFYSGTVAAAFAGYIYGIRSMAVSLVGNRNQEGKGDVFNFEEGAIIAGNVLEKLIQQVSIDGVFNLNIPNPTSGKTEVTSLGFKHYKPSLEERIDPRGRKYFWIGTGDPIIDGEEGTDLRAIQKGNVSLSLLKYDLNCSIESKKLDEVFK